MCALKKSEKAILLVLLRELLDNIGEHKQALIDVLSFRNAATAYLAEALRTS